MAVWPGTSNGLREWPQTGGAVHIPLLGVCLELISISCVYAIPAGTSRRPCTFGSAPIPVSRGPAGRSGAHWFTASEFHFLNSLLNGGNAPYQQEKHPFLSVFCITNLANFTAEGGFIYSGVQMCDHTLLIASKRDQSAEQVISRPLTVMKAAEEEVKSVDCNYM